MNLLLFTGDDRLAPDRIELRGRRLAHLRAVLGARVGDTLRVGEVDGLLGSGEVLELDAGRAIVGIALDREPPPKLPVTLVLALPRPKVLRRVLRSVAEYGVRELILLHSYRVQKSYWQTPVLQPAILRDYLLQGLEQAVDTRPPAVHCRRRFKPWVEDELPALAAAAAALVAHPGPYPTCPDALPGERLLVIGPEGGFIPYEIDKLEAAGCAVHSLGPRILRVENAVAGLLGRIPQAAAS